MKKQEILDSGILELYALGELNEFEQKYLFQVLKEYPDLKIELANIEDSLRVLALKAAIEPDFGLIATIY